MNIRGKITYKPIVKINKVQQRVLDFNPDLAFKRITIDPYSRRQNLSMGELFPSPDRKKCACGCGKALKGRQTRWSGKECQSFAVAVYDVICNNTPTIKRLMSFYTPWICCKCKKEEDYREFKNGLAVSDLEIDHVVAVKNGGGGCWLGNYQVICHACHKGKTTVDNRIRNTPSQLQPSKLFK